MRNIGLSKLQNLLFVLFLFALTGCGASNSNIAGTDGVSNGKITAKFDWAADGKSTAKTVAAVPTGVLSVRLKVTGPTVNGATYTRVKASFPAADGGGTVAVSPGAKLIVTAEALGAGDVLLYEGFKREVTVTSGATTDLGTISMAAPNYKVADEPCLGCHENTRGITGQSIVADYKGSRHYSVTVSPNPKFGVNSVGCAGCHGPSHNDLTPSASGRCAECHNSANGFGSNTDLRDKHYSATALVAGAANAARYLNLNSTNCSGCHEPHNLNSGNAERADWAASGHGDVTAPAWTFYDFTLRDNCNTCHTPAGFVKAMGNGWVDTTAQSTTVTSGKQPLSCAGCHSGNDFKVRTLGAYNAGMGSAGGSYTVNQSARQASIQYPDAGESNVCIPCHAGTDNGAAVINSVTDFTNVGFRNPHYLAAAATFYGKGGFQFYTSGVRYNTYGAAGKVGKLANWSHGRLGMDNYSASGNNDLAGKSNATGTKGQCIACHLGAKNTHTFGAAEVANATMSGATNTSSGSALTRTCYGCHKGYASSAITTIEGFIDEEKEIWNRLFDFFNYELAQKNIFYTTNYPYFTKVANGTAADAIKNWTYAATIPVGPATGTGAQNMGVALNYKLLVAEKGSFVHNRAFGRALMSDSIAYLQKGSNMEWYNTIKPNQNDLINFSNYSAARPTSYPGQVGPDISITTLKSYLTRTATGGYTRR